MTDMEYALRPMSLGDVLDYSVEIFRRNFRQLSIAALILYTPFITIYTLVSGYMMTDLAKSVRNTVEQPNTLYRLAGWFTGAARPFAAESGLSNEFAYTIAALYLVYIVIGILYLIYSFTIKPVLDGAITKIVIEDILNRRKIKATDAIKAAFKKFGSFAGYKVLYILIVFGLGIACFIIYYILLVVLLAAVLPGIVTNNNISVTLGAVISIILIVLFTLFACFLVAYFSVKFGFGVPAIVMENKTASEALGRSKRITKHSFWLTILSWLLGSILVYFVPQILLTVSGYSILGGSGVYIPIQICLQLAVSLLYPFMPVLTALLYINMKIRREGFDLETRVDMMLNRAREKETALENAAGQ